MIGRGELAVPAIGPGRPGAVEWPGELTRLVDQMRAGEVWLTVGAVLGEAESWAPAGHEVAWAQERMQPTDPMSHWGGYNRPNGTTDRFEAVLRDGTALRNETAPGSAAGMGAEPGGGDVITLGAAEPGGGDVVTLGAAERDGGDVVTLGAARFDGRTGMLRELGGLELDGPRLDLWRAPIDNDRPLVGGWRRAGLDRMHHKVLGVQADGAGLSVRTRVGAAGTGLGMDVVYQWRAEGDQVWRAEGDQVWLTVAVTPLGSWDVPLPRLGVALSLAGQEAELEWFGLGPGEAYRDSDSAVRVGRYRRTLAELQTPYVRPQENGNRRAVRWARLTRPDGAVLSIFGRPGRRRDGPAVEHRGAGRRPAHLRPAAGRADPPARGRGAPRPRQRVVRAAGPGLAHAGGHAGQLHHRAGGRAGTGRGYHVPFRRAQVENRPVGG